MCIESDKAGPKCRIQTEDNTEDVTKVPKRRLGVNVLPGPSNRSMQLRPRSKTGGVLALDSLS